MRNTIEAIHNIHPEAEIYWIVGCDNILHIDKWYKWQNIFESTNIVVCERSDMSIKIYNTKAAHNFNKEDIFNVSQLNGVTHGNSFFMLHIKKINISSTQIRSMLYLN
jgi:nicotinate-nucleotide adenylyltransferase